MLPANTSTTPAAGSTDALTESASVVIPVIEEQLQIHTELVETGRIRVSKRVEEIEQVVDVPVTREIVDVQRVPVDRIIEQVPPSRQEGDTLILPVVREEVVTTVRLVLVEEVHITRRQEQTIDQQTVILRRESIDIDRSDPPQDQPVTDTTP